MGTFVGDIDTPLTRSLYRALRIPSPSRSPIQLEEKSLLPCTEGVYQSDSCSRSPRRPGLLQTMLSVIIRTRSFGNLTQREGTAVTTMTVYSVFEFEKTLVLWWHTAMPVEGVNECVALGERMMLRDKVSFLTLIDAGVDLKAPPESRRGIADFLARNDKRIAAAAIVYGAAGFKASALRSIITAINLASRATFPSKVFAETEQGLNWLGEQTRMPPLSAQRLLHACKQRQSQLAS